MLEAKVLLLSVVVSASRVPKSECARDAWTMGERDSFPFIFASMYFSHLNQVDKKNLKIMSSFKSGLKQQMVGVGL